MAAMKKFMKIHGKILPRPFWPAIAGAAAIVSLLTSCAHGPRAEESAAREISRLQMPRLIGSPAAALLASSDGYIADVQFLENGAPGLSAQLFSRQNKLCLIPVDNSHSRRGGKDDISFIWDTSENNGFVLCETLQGYARIGSTHHYSVSPVEADATTQPEIIDGHNCLLEQITVMADDGTISRFDAWRATDLKNVRLKIVSSGEATLTGAMLSKVSLELPPMEMFAPPADFTAYPSVAAMQDELDRRAQTLRGPSREPAELPPNYGDPRTYHPPTSGGY